jgi:hypothetical protein
MDGRYVDNGDGTVTDNCTGLMWQQATAPGAYTWTEALQYCDQLELGMNPETDEAYDDWRLPNVRELQSIVDYGRTDPAIAPVFRAGSSPYWSSSTSEHNRTNAWHVYSGYGNINSTIKANNVDDKGNPMYVRAVRTIQPGE